MVGFTRALMYAGTPSVILSLWEVGDDSTKELFVNYYSKLSKDGSEKYAPLRDTQLRMIESGKYSNPYYWAPFVFIGERESKILKLKTMKTIFSITICLLAFISVFGQTVEYYDGDWNRIDSKEGAEYYREINYDEKGKPIGLVKDYYITGELQFTGRMISIDPELMDGTCTWYYKNGQKSQEATYQRGAIVQGPRNWSRNGKEEGVLDGSGFYFSATYIKQQYIEIKENLEQIVDSDSIFIDLLQTKGWDNCKNWQLEEGLRLFQLAHDLSKSIEDEKRMARSFFLYRIYLFQSRQV